MLLKLHCVVNIHKFQEMSSPKQEMHREKKREKNQELSYKELSAQMAFCLIPGIFKEQKKNEIFTVHG